MQQSVSPKIVALIVVVLVAVVGLVGYKFVFKPNSSSGKPPPEAEKWLNPGGTMKPAGGRGGMTGGNGAPGMQGNR